MSDFSGTVPEVIKYRQLPIASSGGEAPNCEVQHPVDLANVRQLHSKLLPVEKAQVNYRKQGRNVFYSLSDSHALNIYRELLSHLLRLPDT